MGTPLILLALLIVYGLVLWGLVYSIRRLGVPSKWAIVLAFLAFGVGTGVWAALVSPQDSLVLINFPAVFFGDALYQWSIQYLGNPHSFQAHYTIPWLLRVPQVYVLASIVLWGLFGLAVQLIYIYWRK